MLAGEHDRLGADPPGEEGHAGLEPGPGHLGRRPRVRLEENRKFLQQGGGAYIIGEKLRSGSAEAKAALSRQGRYKTVAGNLQVKEVRLPDAGDRFIICFNPDQAIRDAAVRDKMITALEEMIAGSDQLSTVKRAELRGRSP